MYKVGQQVRCVGEREPGDEFEKGAGWQPGLVFTITRITGDQRNSGRRSVILWGGANEGSGVYAEYAAPMENNLTGWYASDGFLTFKEMTREQIIIALAHCYTAKENYQASKAVSLEKELDKRMGDRFDKLS